MDPRKIVDAPYPDPPGVFDAPLPDPPGMMDAPLPDNEFAAMERAGTPAPVEPKPFDYSGSLGGPEAMLTRGMSKLFTKSPEAPKEYWTDPRSGERYPVVEVDGRKLYEKKPGYRYSIPPEGLQEGVAAPKGVLESGQMVETLTDPKEMAKGAGLVAGLGAGAGLVGTAFPRTAPYLMPFLETSIPIETAANLSGGITDVGRLAAGIGRGAVKSAAGRGAFGETARALEGLSPERIAPGPAVREPVRDIPIGEHIGMATAPAREAVRDVTENMAERMRLPQHLDAVGPAGMERAGFAVESLKPPVEPKLPPRPRFSDAYDIMPYLSRKLQKGAETMEEASAINNRLAAVDRWTLDVRNAIEEELSAGRLSWPEFQMNAGEIMRMAGGEPPTLPSKFGDATFPAERSVMYHLRKQFAPEEFAELKKARDFMPPARDSEFDAFSFRDMGRRPLRRVREQDFLDVLEAKFPQMARHVERLRSDRGKIRDQLEWHFSLDPSDARHFTPDDVVRDPHSYLTPEVAGKYATDPEMRESIVDMIARRYGMAIDREGRPIVSEGQARAGEWYERSVGRSTEGAAAPPEVTRIENPKNASERLAWAQQVAEEQARAGNRHFVELDPVQGKMKSDAVYAAAQAQKKKINSVTVERLTSWISKHWTNDKALLEKRLEKFGEAGRLAIRKYSRFLHISGESLRQYTEASDGVFKGLSRQAETDLDRYIDAFREIEIAAYKPEYLIAEGKRAGDNIGWLQSLNSEYRAMLDERAEAYWSALKNQLQQKLDAGVLSQEQFEAITAQGRYYSPREYLNRIDPDGMGKVAVESDPVRARSIGVKRLEEGADSYVNYSARELLQDVVVATQSLIARNDANRALWNIAKSVDDEIARMAGLGNSDAILRMQKEMVLRPHEFGDEAAGWELLDFMDKGKKVTFEMRAEMAEEWTQMNALIKPGAAKILSWMNMANVTRSFATAYNPAFAMKNMVRDMFHNVFVNPHYSTELFTSLGEIVADMWRVKGDAWRKTGRYVDYVREGGSMDVLGNLARNRAVDRVFGRAANFAAKLSEFSESTVRLASRERAMRAGLSGEEATHIALNALDFRRGGDVAKIINVYTPFFNATIQGTRSLGLAAWKNPGRFSMKLAELGALTMFLEYANRNVNRAAWDSISEIDKANNFIFPWYGEHRDAQGNKRWYYIRMPKDLPQRFWSSIFEAAVAIEEGRDPKIFQRVWMAANDMLNFSSMVEGGGLTRAVLAYAMNFDVWRGEKVWRGANVDPELEYNRYTPEEYKELGQRFGLSPMRLQRAMDALFPRNAFTSAAGLAKDLATGKGEKYAEQGGKVSAGVVLRQTPLVQEFVRSSAPETRVLEDRNEEIERKYNSERQRQKHRVDELYDKFEKTGDRSVIKDLRSYMQSQPAEDRRWIFNRFRSSSRLKDVPNRSWWLDLQYADGEARAEMFHERFRKADEAQQGELWKTLSRLQLNRDRDFRRQWSRLRRSER